MTRRKPNPSDKARRLVNRFAMRAEDFAFMGGRPPDEHAIINRMYERSRNELLEYIESLESRPSTVKSDIMPGD